MYKIEITADTIVELAGRVAALAHELTAQKEPFAVDSHPLTREAEPGEQAVAGKVEGPEPNKVEETTTSAPVETVGVGAGGEGPKDDKPPRPPYDYETTIKPLVLAVVAKRGRDAGLKLLAEFGVDKAPLLPQEKRPAFVEAANKLLAA